MRFLLAAALALAPAVARADEVLNDLFLAVLAHEMGHAAIREFDLPVTASEEAMADAFAVVLLDAERPEEAGRIIARRAAAHLGEGEAAAPFSEYPSDAARAQADLCLVHALDPEGRAEIGVPFGMDAEAAAACRDFGAEIGRGWRRLIAPLRMPEGARVTEVEIDLSEDFDSDAVPSRAAARTAFELLAAIDWHSRITLRLEACDDSASWSRNGREITICDGYLLRLVEAEARGR